MFKHPRSGMYWFRWVVPARLRPVVPAVAAFPDKPGRTEFTISLGTDDVRIANTRAAKYEHAIAQAKEQAEHVLTVSRVKPSLATIQLPESPTDPAAPLMLHPRLVWPAIAAWRDAEIETLHHRAYNHVPSEAEADRFDAEHAELVKALRLIATGNADLHGGAKQLWGALTALVTEPGEPSPKMRPETAALAERRQREWMGQRHALVDGKIADVLARHGMRVAADHPAIRHERRRFAQAWLDVLTAHRNMLLGTPDFSVLVPEAFAGPDEQPRQSGKEAPAEPYDLLAFLAGFDAWAGQLQMEPRQAQQYQADVREFAERIPQVTLGGLTRKHVDGWVAALVGRGLKAKTIDRKLASARNYWRFLHEDEHVKVPERGPFHNVKLPFTRKERRQQEAEGEIANFSPEEVARVWRKARERDDQPLADLIRLGAFCGARIESMCALRCEQITRDAVSGILFMPFNDKTPSGQRKVPVHPAIQAMVRRLMRDSADGFLIPSSAKNKYGDRSPPLGKRFGRLKTAMGFDDRHVFHSIRGSVISMYLNAEVGEAITADTVGHDIPTVTYGTYGEVALTTKLAKLKQVVLYPDAEFMTAG